jgi:hypothetical protein
MARWEFGVNENGNLTDNQTTTHQQQGEKAETSEVLSRSNSSSSSTLTTTASTIYASMTEPATASTVSDDGSLATAGPGDRPRFIRTIRGAFCERKMNVMSTAYTHSPSSIKSNRMAETAVSFHCISLIESIATNLHRTLINANFKN